jgi:hypothetical protein
LLLTARNNEMTGHGAAQKEILLLLLLLLGAAGAPGTTP